MMKPEHWQKAKEIVPTVRELPAAEREAFLDEVCGDDAELRKEIDALLAADLKRIAFIEHPPLKLLEVPTSWIAQDQQFGAYRIRRQLGHGGMGIVYLATRADDEFERDVAIKVLRPGLDGDDFDRRFRQEIQILANLNHPYIAKLHEGGRTEDGRLYFLMEYIDGTSIDRYCDHKKLSTTKRLEHFRKICSAVQYAHRNLVVHRDLKPGNILVTAAGEPKLLDFGVAKILSSSEGTSSQTLTLGSFRLMTLEYASPEQVKGERITTASDVYSLGILLYELLTGHRPYRVESRKETEIKRVICEEEPEKPSTVVQKQLTQTGDSRLKKLHRRLAGDLDTIILMALRKEPERRYATVEQFSEDIWRSLVGLPVIAQKDTLRYRTGKFIWRHRTAVTILTTAILLVTAFVMALAFQQRRTVQERDKAQQVAKFLEEMFEVSDPTTSQGEKITARELLDKGAERIRQELTHQPKVRASLMYTMGRAYLNLGLYESSRPLLEESLGLLRQFASDEDMELATRLNALGELSLLTGSYAEAETFFKDALEIQRKSTGEGSSDFALGLENLALMHYIHGEYEESERLYRKALATRIELVGRKHIETAETLNNLALTLKGMGAYESAEKMYKESLNIKIEKLGIEHQDVAATSYNLAELLRDIGRYAEAEPYGMQALTIDRKIFGEKHPNVAFDMNFLATLLHYQGRLNESESLFRETLIMRREFLGENHPEVGRTLNNLALVLLDTNQYQEAEHLERHALSIMLQHFDERHPEILTNKHNLAKILMEAGENSEAETLLRQTLEVRREVLGMDHPSTCSTLRNLAVLSINQGNYTRAKELAQEVLETTRKIYPEVDWRIADAESILGATLTGLGQYDAAEALLLPSYSRIVGRGPGPRARQALESIVRLYEDWGNETEATKYRALLQ